MITDPFPAPTPSRSPIQPSFVIGRDVEGHWLAVEVHGLAGGFFDSEAAAFRYATFETDHRRGAVVSVSAPLVLRLSQ